MKARCSFTALPAQSAFRSAGVKGDLLYPAKLHIRVHRQSEEAVVGLA